MIEDSQLLRQYVRHRSQTAFAELALRHRKAASLLDRPVLTGWLYTRTRFAAAQAVRTERRRRFMDFEVAAGVLKDRGLVSINPENGMVGLTPRGRLFCAHHADKIDGR